MKKTIMALGMLAVLGVTQASGHSESADQKTDKFLEEKVLTVSAGDYAASSLTNLSEFEMKGVHVYGRNDCLDTFRSTVKQRYPQAVVVVNYTLVKADNYAFCYGTVLVPKK